MRRLWSLPRFGGQRCIASGTLLFHTSLSMSLVDSVLLENRVKDMDHQEVRYKKVLNQFVWLKWLPLLSHYYQLCVFK